MPRQRRLVLSLVVLAGTLTLSSGARADHAWGSVPLGPDQNPFALRTGDNVTSAWTRLPGRSHQRLESSTVLDLVKVSGAAKGKNCRPTAGRIEVCNAAYGNNGWLGIAQIWATGAHITQAVAKMNDTYFNTAHLQHAGLAALVMCQEIAHDFGLDHQDENFNNAEPRLVHGLHERSRRPAQQRTPERARLRPAVDHLRAPRRHHHRGGGAAM